MGAGNLTSGGFLADRTAVLDLPVYILVAIAAALLLVGAILAFLFFRRRAAASRVKHTSGIIPSLTKEISVDRVVEGGVGEVEVAEEKKGLVGVNKGERLLGSSLGASSSEAAERMGNIGWGRWYSLVELEAATGGFSAGNVIGEGGYGVVYKGVMPDLSIVAVKNLLNNNSSILVEIGGKDELLYPKARKWITKKQVVPSEAIFLFLQTIWPPLFSYWKEVRGQAEKEFKVEVEAIGKVRHKNLVGLVGYCAEGAKRMLVYEYIDNGNLERWLHGDVGPVSPLTWDIRIKIAIGTAKGIAYLHEGLEPKVVHRDIKSSNILLDKHWNAKVSDFGLAKLLGSGSSFVTTRVMGTFGYVAPEYACTGMLNESSDVYSFGVLLMEIISGRCPVDYSRLPGEVNLVDWFKGMVGSRRGEEVVDPLMEVQPSPRALKRVLLVCLRCVDLDAQKRPNMGQIVHMLEGDEFPFRMSQ
ncbi:putative receptor-like serine/threonine-protein kinase [Cocos nucifera]|uniref:non-specific serine/threonine protein kinase n=1 Tax=Cocos nucifera TaxID=13894 RepID=A0A8K0NBH3_COCNU|nr:putative receptor-like serine/threonine-protein kinase [Cocos nucifera]